jgi:hypothetical protein
MNPNSADQCYKDAMSFIKDEKWNSIYLYEGAEPSSVNQLIFGELASVSPFTEDVKQTMERLYPKPSPPILFDTICFTRSKEALSYLLTKLPYPNLLNQRGANLINAYISQYITNGCDEDDDWVIEKVRMMIEHGIQPDLPNDRHEVAAQMLEGMEAACYICDNWKLMRLLHRGSFRK